LEAHCPVFKVHGFGEKVDADGRLVCVVKGIVHKSSDQRRLAHRLLAQKDQLQARRMHQTVSSKKESIRGKANGQNAAQLKQAISPSASSHHHRKLTLNFLSG
jgi:hypothetical protein